MSTHWIEFVTIEGFRNIRNLKMDGLGGLNILVGENNSGKTSILEALSILTNFNDPLEWLSMVGRRDFGRLDENRAQSIRWCFDRMSAVNSTNPTNDRLKATCEFGCRGLLCNGEFRIDCHEIVSGPPFRTRISEETPDPELDVPESRRGIQLRYHYDDHFGARLSRFDETEWPSLVVWEDEFVGNYQLVTKRERPVETATLNPYSYQINRLQVRRLSGVHRSIGDLLELLRGFDPEIMDIELGSSRGGRPAITITHTRLGSAPLSIFGDALRRAVLLATTLLSFKNGGILFIDEIETGIHVHALQRVFSWLAKNAITRNVQVFVTTHSLEALDAIVFSTPDARKEVVAFHLEQSAEGTTARRFDGDLLQRLRRERGIDVR